MVTRGQVYKAPNFVKDRRVVVILVDDKDETAWIVPVSLEKKPQSSTDLLAEDGKVYQCWNVRIVPLGGFAAMELVGEVTAETRIAIKWGLCKSWGSDYDIPEELQFGPPILDQVKDRDRIEHQTMETNVMNTIVAYMGGETH